MVYGYFRKYGVQKAPPKSAILGYPVYQHPKSLKGQEGTPSAHVPLRMWGILAHLGGGCGWTWYPTVVVGGGEMLTMCPNP